MDIFMDKLAQRSNAQEIIRANTTAEIEELDKLRSRVAEYNECLDKLQKLVNGGADGIKSASRENVAEINRLVEASLVKIKEIQQDASGLEKLGRQLENANGQLGNISVQQDCVAGQLGNMSEQLENVNSQLKSVSGELSGKVDLLTRQLEEKDQEKPGDRLDEKFAVADENVHKECVKVYRNVQAVVMEESGKQNETLADISGKLNATRSRLGIVLGISAAALVFSLAGAVLQLLDLMGIGLF